MSRIMTVDDEVEWLELYAEVLRDAGHDVESYADGVAAVRSIRVAPPDLVILDIRMGPSGRQVLKSIREAHPDLPVIMSSAYGGYRDDPDFAMADGFVEKSTDLTELIQMVRGVLAKADTP